MLKTADEMIREAQQHIECVDAQTAKQLFDDNDGAMIHPTTDTPDPALVDRDVMLYGVKAGFGVKGARIGSAEGEAKLFRDDMLAFWQRVLGNQ